MIKNLQSIRSYLGNSFNLIFRELNKCIDFDNFVFETPNNPTQEILERRDLTLDDFKNCIDDILLKILDERVK